MPQGSVLGPLLFIIYINDLHKCLKFSNCIQFADDTTMYLAGEGIKSTYECLNNDLTNIMDWFRANCLSLNLQKTKYMLFNHKYDSTNIPNLIVGGNTIERVKKAKFLGILLDDKLNWDEHIKHCRKKIVSGLYALNAMKHYLRTQHLRCLYFAMVHPFLQYGCVLWGGAAKKVLNTLRVLQKKAIRAVCKARYNTPTNRLFKKLHILKLDDIYSLEVSKFMYKVSNKLAPLPIVNHFTPNTNIHRYNTRQCRDFHIKPAANSLALKSLLYTGPRKWLALPTELKSSTSLKSFVNKIKKKTCSEYNEI